MQSGVVKIAAVAHDRYQQHQRHHRGVLGQQDRQGVAPVDGVDFHAVHEHPEYDGRGTKGDDGAQGQGLRQRPASGKHRVLLIEAGGPDKNFWIPIPLGMVRMIANPAIAWPTQDTPKRWTLTGPTRPLAVPAGPQRQAACSADP